MNTGRLRTIACAITKRKFQYRGFVITSHSTVFGRLDANKTLRQYIAGRKMDILPADNTYRWMKALNRALKLMGKSPFEIEDVPHNRIPLTIIEMEEHAYNVAKCIVFDTMSKRSMRRLGFRNQEVSFSGKQE